MFGHDNQDKHDEEVIHGNPGQPPHDQGPGLGFGQPNDRGQDHPQGQDHGQPHDATQPHDDAQAGVPQVHAPEPATIAPGPHPAGAPAFLPTPAAPAAGAVPPAGATDDLLDIKQEALQALTPLVSQLEQTPEEQFRTTMMMIQASDNHSLIKVAYDAAQKISNEKERAQALLDIVNEINYFTQHAQAA